MRENIAAAMKQALKDKDQAALGTMRLIMAALKDRDIAARGNGNPDGISDDDILGLLQTMIKQRTESAKMYKDGGRPELAAALGVWAMVFLSIAIMGAAILAGKRGGLFKV